MPEAPSSKLAISSVWTASSEVIFVVFCSSWGFKMVKHIKQKEGECQALLLAPTQPVAVLYPQCVSGGSV